MIALPRVLSSGPAFSMDATRLIDQLMEILGAPKNATRAIIERDWQAQTLRVSFETIPEPVTVDEANQVLRAFGDFELREVMPDRDSIEIQQGS